MKYNPEYEKLNLVTFDSFRELAKDQTLSRYEKIGFPDSHRADFEMAIFADLKEKTKLCNQTTGPVLDIGCGCTDVCQFLINFCSENKQELHLIDSAEMLSCIENPQDAELIAGQFPFLPEFSAAHRNYFEVIIIYSVIQIVYREMSLPFFVEEAISLLRPGGRMLIGDIPNESKKKRFLSSPAGIEYHKNYMQTQTPPVVNHHDFEGMKISDGILLGLISHIRQMGLEAYLLPQPSSLPMFQRREDLLIVKH